MPPGSLEHFYSPVYELRLQNANHGSIEDWDYLEASSSQSRSRAANLLTRLHNYIAAFLGKSLQNQDSLLLRPTTTKALILEIHQPR